MIKKKSGKKNNLPVIRIDKSLDKYKDTVLFPEKVEKAKETLKKVGLPKHMK